MANDQKDSYEVGYGKPPEHSRFRKGQSGNPKGRPRGSKNLSTLLDDALDEPVVVMENGQRKRITKRQALLKQLVNKAAGGNTRAIQMLLGEMRLVEGRELAAPQSMLFDEADQAVIRQLYVRFRGAQITNDHTEVQEGNDEPHS